MLSLGAFLAQGLAPVDLLLPGDPDHVVPELLQRDADIAVRMARPISQTAVTLSGRTSNVTGSRSSQRMRLRLSRTQAPLAYRKTSSGFAPANV